MTSTRQHPVPGWGSLASGATSCTPDGATITSAAVNTTCEQLSRPYFSKFPYLSQIIQISDQDFSTYNGMQATLTGRPSHGASYLVGYTYAHALSEADGDWNGSSIPRNPLDVRDSLGNSNTDVRNRMTVSLTYALPEKKGFYQLLEGWKLNSIANIQSALPWTVTDASNQISGIGDSTDTWNFYGNSHNFDGLGAGFQGPEAGIPYYSGTTNPFCASQATALDALYKPTNTTWSYTNALTRYGCYELNGSMLLPPAFGTIGNTENGLFRGRGLKLWDVSLEKSLRFTEQFNGTFRFEVFNILNMTQYGPPSATMSATGNQTFGVSTATPDVNISATPRWAAAHPARFDGN